jgi:hypothetical protein
LDARLYEWFAYFVIFLIGITGSCFYKGITPAKEAFKFCLLRIAFSLAVAPGIIGNALLSLATYLFWANTKGVQFVGKDVAAGSMALWIFLSIILIIDFIILIMHAYSNRNEQIFKQLESSNSNPLFINPYF